MVKYRYSGCLVQIILFLIINFSISAYAHEGHDQNNEMVLTIEKKTYVHFQAVLMGYQYIYSYMVKGGSEEVSCLAQNVIDAANLGIQSEPEGPGQHMMQHILEGAEALKNAKDVSERQEAFTSISNALFPFFRQWPNQLMRSRLKICRCKGGHQWLQPDNCPTVCPYSQKKSSSCLMIEETKY